MVSAGMLYINNRSVFFPDEVLAHTSGAVNQPTADLIISCTEKIAVKEVFKRKEESAMSECE